MADVIGQLCEGSKCECNLRTGNGDRRKTYSAICELWFLGDGDLPSCMVPESGTSAGGVISHEDGGAEVAR